MTGIIKSHTFWLLISRNNKQKNMRLQKLWNEFQKCYKIVPKENRLSKDKLVETFSYKMLKFWLLMKYLIFYIVHIFPKKLNLPITYGTLLRMLLNTK